MKKPTKSILAAAMGLAAVIASPVSHADGFDARSGHVRVYAVTVTNITRGQPIAPPAVVVHDGRYSMFDLGAPASPELAQLAEQGAAGPLLAMAAGMPSVHGTAAGGGLILPGASQTIQVTAIGKSLDISVAGMLVSTNDAFMAVRGIDLPARGAITVLADAYDAGSEANSENCAFVPGPPCGGGAHDPAPAEGYVHIHAGIHGIGGLTPATHDWRGAVAQIRIERID